MKNLLKALISVVLFTLPSLVLSFISAKWRYQSITDYLICAGFPFCTYYVYPQENGIDMDGGFFLNIIFYSVILYFIFFAFKTGKNKKKSNTGAYQDLAHAWTKFINGK